MIEAASSPAQQRPLAIDVHAHIIPTVVGGPDVLWGRNGHPVTRRADRQLAAPDPVGGQVFGRRHDAARLDERIAEMDRLGVQLQVLSLLPPLWTYVMEGHDSKKAAQLSNDELIGIAEQHPDRFRVFAHLPLAHPEAAVTELERVLQSDVVVGAAVGTNVSGQHWDDPELFGVLQAASDLGTVLFFHPMLVRLNPFLNDYHLRNLIGNPTETTIAIADLIFGGVMTRLPELKTVFAHGGGYACHALGRFDHGYRVRPEAQRNTAELPSHILRRMYFDNLLHDDAAMRYLVDQVGLDQVVLGSDWPADMGPDDPVNQVLESSQLSEAEKRAILSENLVRLLNLDVKSLAPTG